MSALQGHDAVALDARDDVATVLRDIAHGDVVRALVGDRTVEVEALEPIALCHKIALRDVGGGEPIRKYGEIIGEAAAPIACGAHVHVHNLRSRRASEGR